MNFPSVVSSLYTLNGIVAVALYLPQIRAAARGGRGSSSLTYCGWSMGALVTALYAWCVVGDLPFTLISLGHALGSGTVFLLTLAGRRKGHLQRQGTKRSALVVSSSTSRRVASR